MTDEFADSQARQGRYSHHTVTHARGKYVREGVMHTNGIEGAWSRLKRQIIGSHHFVSAKHLGCYEAEATWRYNRRSAQDAPRLNALIAGASGRLTYKELIA
jgi:hypothetical protein